MAETIVLLAGLFLYQHAGIDQQLLITVQVIPARRCIADGKGFRGLTTDTAVFEILDRLRGLLELGLEVL